MMAGLFAKAEEVVSRFFRDRVDDPTRGTIDIHGERYLLIRGAALSVEFFDLVRTLYAPEQRADADEFARAILFDLAHAMGRSDAQNFHRVMQLSDPVAKMSAGPVHFAHAGWAFVEISSETVVSEGDDFVGVYDHPYSFESDAWVRAGRTNDSPVCIMNAGYSSGWSEASFDRKLVAAELLCRAKGDATCRFIMAPPHRIEGQIAAYLARHPEVTPHVARFRIPDFFARKREEEALKLRQEQLERELRQTQKLEALGRLAGGIAHDFNNLISVVLGQAMLAQRRVLPTDPLAKDLAKIVRAGERAAALTQQLLAFGRSQVAHNEVLDLNAIVDATARMIEPLIGDDIELVLQLAPNAGNVNADRAQLEQILMNLAVNGRDAMPSGGRLSISTQRESPVNGLGNVTLRVADNGVGMEEDVRARAFEPFYTTKGSRGTGLGLSTVYGIVTNAGGTIEIDSRKGQGCSVSITLPSSVHLPEKINIAHIDTIAGTGTVLVVDDKLELLDVVGQSLEAYGYQPLLANTVDEALTLLADATCHIDVLLTDIVMPRMNGVDLAAHAVKLRPKIKVLYMSGHAPDPQHRALFADGGTAFLQKPFTPESLALRLAETISAE
jgi:signal transduction histidine kinase/CheY-like chemotaxis protein